MSDDLLTSLLRAYARDSLRALAKESGAPLRELMQKVMTQEMRALIAEHIAVESGGPTLPLPLDVHLTDPVRRNRNHVLRHPTYMLVRKNLRFIGAPFSPGSKAQKVWAVVLQHLADREMVRRDLLKELLVLLPDIPMGTISGCVTMLLDKGALLARLPDEHKIGEAYRG
jgi:hypothetical protein